MESPGCPVPPTCRFTRLRGLKCAKPSLGDASSPWPDGSPARRAASPCICPRAGPGRTSSVAPWHDSARCLSRPDGARSPLTQLPRQLAPGPVRECFLPCPIPPSRSPQPSQAAISTPNSADRPPANLQSTRIRARTVASVTSSPPSAILAPSIGGFGLRTMLSKLPGYKERSNLSDDISRLEKHKSDIVATAREDNSELAEAVEICIEQLKRAFDETHYGRNVLAHGQMAQVASETITINSSQQRTPNEKHEGWLEISHPRWGTVKLTEVSLDKELNSARDLQSKVGDLNGLVQWMNASKTGNGKQKPCLRGT